MRLVSSIRHTDQTPEGVFANKYAWLMRWAMHFSRNDRSAAEDLVQDAFVRMLLSWDKLHSLHDLEPLLYSYLRYAHLTGLRKVNNSVLQSLSTVDSDTLAISLRISNSFDQIEVQNELRSILHYLLWRRDSAKFASIFLLRFFHGFYPEEIASICIATRHSIDLSLRHARAEVKRCLLDPHSVEVPGKRRMPELQQPNIAVPADEFVQELRREMFSRVRDSCPASTEIERNYRSASQRSLDCSFLAHIVTCEPCLEKVTRVCGAPPPSARSMEDSLGAASRTKPSKKSPATEKASVARAITESKRRFRELLEHDPTGLMIALNGEVLAVRDVSSRRAVLKVEAHATERLEVVEIFSEQRTLLLALPILENSPPHSPKIRHHIRLAADRTLSLVVEFSSNGVSAEATYEDPHFSNDERRHEESGVFPFPLPEIELADIRPQAPAELSAVRSAIRYWRPHGWRSALSACHHLLASLRSWSLGLKPFGYVSMCLAATLGAALWFYNGRMNERRRFDSSLQRSVEAERQPYPALEHAAVHRRLEIHAMGRIFDRDLYSDTEGHRRERQHSLSPAEQMLKIKLAEASLDWNDPLTAASFARWRDGLGTHGLDVEQNHGNLIVMTSTVRDGMAGAVKLESLTMRSNDFHPIARKIVFQDGESVEIAEVAYDVVPWNDANPDWFEPENAARIPSMISGHTEHGIAASLAAAPTEGEIDLAALGVLQAIEEMHADTERLEVKRTRRDIEVSGVVESIARKQQLQARLKLVPNVRPEIFSYQEMDAKSGSASAPQALKAVSVSSADSQLDARCRVLQIEHDECQRRSYRLLSSTAILSRESKRLTELQLQFPAAKPLTSEANKMLASLVAGHLDHLKAALWDQQETLRMLQLWPASEADNADDGATLINAAAQNQADIRDLVYASKEGARPTNDIVRDLAQSLQEARNALSHMPTYAAANTATSSGNSTPQEY